MASHSLAIAKASLAASLMRAEPSPVLRTDITQFHHSVDALLSRCTATNIELCKQWLLRNVIPSAARIGALGKYLVALSASTSAITDIRSTDQGKTLRSSSRAQQIAILYLLHDLLHHMRFHHAILCDTNEPGQVLEPYVLQLVFLASSYNPNIHSRHLRKLNDLIAIWANDNFYALSFIATLHQTLNDALHVGKTSSEKTGGSNVHGVWGNTVTAETRKDVPYIMPPNHGDASTPFYDLPAGNLLPCIVPNSTIPIKPQNVRPLQFRAGPADETLVHAVKGLLHDTDSIYGTEEPATEWKIQDIDELGQLLIRDDTLEETAVNDGYYGWSRAFCDRMKLRSCDDDSTELPRARENRTLSAYKRQQYNRSDSSGSRSRFSSRSRSPAPGRIARRMRKQRRDSSSRSRSHPRPRHVDKVPSPASVQMARLTSSRSRSRSYSPPDVPLPDDRPADEVWGSFSAPGQNRVSQLVPPPTDFFQHGSLDSRAIAIPPPPPRDYRGPWPPPPPPLAPAMLAQTFQRNAQASQAAHYALPPPPPSPAPNVHMVSTQGYPWQSFFQYPRHSDQSNFGNSTELANQSWQYSQAATDARGQNQGS